MNGVHIKRNVPQYLFLAILTIAILCLRYWLIDKRWINPDEGAHLMDGLLTLKGYIPFVDFDSRQPLYVFVNALWLKLLGLDYIYGRYLPMIFSLATTSLVFLIAKHLFNNSVAFLAAVIYLIIPFENLNSVVVKTEPMANFLACLSLYFLLKFNSKHTLLFLSLSGLSAALCYYVRQSALVLPIIGFFTIVWDHRTRLGDKVIGLSLYFFGYFLAVIALLLYYWNFFSVQQLIESGLFPFGFILTALKNVWYLLSGTIAPAGLEGMGREIGTQTENSVKYIKTTLYLHTFLLLSIAWAINKILGPKGMDFDHNHTWRWNYLLPLSWFALIVAAYFYHYKVFGYYIDYFRELFPPLAILSAAYLWETIFHKYSRQLFLVIIFTSVATLIFIFYIQSFYVEIPKGVQIVIVLWASSSYFVYNDKSNKTKARIAITTTSLSALFYFFARYVNLPSKELLLMVVFCIIVGATIPMVRNRRHYFNLSIIVSLLVLNTTFSAKILSLSYDSTWHPSTVEKISAVIKNNSTESDSVLSGAVIWEFNAHRKPFGLISHPLVYRHGIGPNSVSKIESAFEMKPPEIIVLDGYTEKTYLKHINWLTDVIQKQYVVISNDDESKYTVQVLKLNKIHNP